MGKTTEEKIYTGIAIFDKCINTIIILTFTIFILYGGYALYDALWVYKVEADTISSIMDYKPSANDTHPSLKELQKINPDVCAWLTIHNTNIDYPIVRGDDNFKYVDTDIYGNYSPAGTIFLDYRNSRDFSDRHSVIYGHYMNNRAMFGHLSNFGEKEFFEKSRTGLLMLVDKTFELEIFAYMDTDAYDRRIFTPNKANEKQFNLMLNHVKNKAVNYRDIEGINDSNIVALTTCATYGTDRRYILLAKLREK